MHPAFNRNFFSLFYLLANTNSNKLSFVVCLLLIIVDHFSAAIFSNQNNSFITLFS